MATQSVISDNQAVSPPLPTRKVKKRVPQVNVDEFWAKFNTEFPGKIHKILPDNKYASTKVAKTPKGPAHDQVAGKSYAEARADCISAVEKIATECRRVNMKYRDHHFDIEIDLKSGQGDFLSGLVPSEDELFPKSVKRVTQIFEKPEFYQDGASANDVRQGANGDCWFMSAICALGNKTLIDKICVHRDEQVGVYGFVFYRDGEWIHTIIDDKLYLIAADFEESDIEKNTWQQVSMDDPEAEYRKACQTGSRALYFAQCRSENETWLPLLEKAYAKAHGDFDAIQGGHTGEGIEDLTGGVTTELFTSDILDIDRFWKDEMMKVNDEFLFGCSTGIFDNWRGTYGGDNDRKGVISRHAYSIMDAREVKGERLVLVRNPWGQGEWKGPWSDGSEQWTPEWMQLLNHKFGDDGIFWISYKDLLRKYQSFDRTRLFGEDWHITQKWTTVKVPWSADYNDTKFRVTLTQDGPTVIVLSQLDERYFRGLEGQYSFSLQFRLEKEGKAGYIARSHGIYKMSRSVSVDLELEAGTYSVLMKVTARRDLGKKTPDEVLRENCRTRPNKITQLGLAYDLAQAKGISQESEVEKKERESREARKAASEKKRLRAELREQKFKRWQLNVKQRARDKRHAKRKEERHRKKAEAAETAKVSEGQEGAVTEATNAQNEINTASINATSGASTGIINGEADAVAESTKGADTADAEPSNLETTATEENNASTAERTVTDSEPQIADKGGPALDIEEPTATASPVTASESIDPTKSQSPTGDLKLDELDKPTREVTQVKAENVVQDAVQKSPKKEEDANVKELPESSETALRPVPDVQVNGTLVEVIATPSPSFISPSITGAPPPLDSDYDSDASFDSSIDTDLDLSRSPVFFAVDPPVAAAQNAVDPVTTADVDDELAEFENDPWNAICVVGLRVYSKDKGVTVEVIRPKEDEEAETPLDMDDISKGASGEPVAKTTLETVNEAADETPKSGI